MNFNSQICTTEEQSKRLLALGLKTETADMYHYITSNGTGISAMDDNFLPHMDTLAWSLHRLIEMLNYQVIHNGKKYEPVIAIDGMTYQDVCNNNPIVGWSGALYTDVIDCIEWLIKEGYFNKEYLEELCGKH